MLQFDFDGGELTYTTWIARWEGEGCCRFLIWNGIPGQSQQVGEDQQGRDSQNICMAGPQTRVLLSHDYILLLTNSWTMTMSKWLENFLLILHKTRHLCLDQNWVTQKLGHRTGARETRQSLPGSTTYLFKGQDKERPASSGLCDDGYIFGIHCTKCRVPRTFCNPDIIVALVPFQSLSENMAKLALSYHSKRHLKKRLNSNENHLATPPNEVKIKENILLYQLTLS